MGFQILIKDSKGERWVDAEKVVAHLLSPQLDKVSLKSIDSNYIAELQKKFPSVDIELQFETFKDYLSSKRKRYKNYKSAFRNFCRNANKWNNQNDEETLTLEWREEMRKKYAK